MKWVRLTAAALALAGLAAPASAQISGYDGEKFVDAVRDKNADTAIELLRKHGGGIVNARDAGGETALLHAITRRDSTWTAYMLKEGADPNVGALRTGDTPLIAAARVGFVDAAQWLIDLGAKVDGTNKMGETPLIVAVQMRQAPMVRYLLQRGADPDRTDAAQGYSARDYAKRDSRTPEILRLIEGQKKVSYGPVAN